MKYWRTERIFSPHTLLEKTVDGLDNATITICADFQRKNATIGANGVKKGLTAGSSATDINPLPATSRTNRPMSATPAGTDGIASRTDTSIQRSMRTQPSTGEDPKAGRGSA